MEVRTINARENAEEDVIRCARGDYTWGSVHGDERSLAGLLDHIEPSEYVQENFGNLTDHPATLEQKIAHFLRKRMHGGEWGIWEHPSATLEIEGLSRSAHAHLIRHRHLTFDVMSNRYVDVSGMDTDELFIYPPSFEEEVVATRDGEREIDATPEARKRMADRVYTNAATAYDQFVEWGVPEEDARFLLPQGQATNLRLSGNARALMHLLNVRLNANVQWEARDGMGAVLAECKEWMPISFSLFDDKRPIPLAP